MKLVLPALLALVVVATGCDVFLEDIGGAGQPCSDDGSCKKGLFCYNDVCLETGGLGDACDFEIAVHYPACEAGLICIDGDCAPAPGPGEECYVPGPFYDPLCQDGLFCIDGVCVEAGGAWEPCMPGDECESDHECIDGICVPSTAAEVKQPNANLYWFKCVGGQSWDGYMCTGPDTPEQLDVIWELADDKCPDEYRRPYLAEVESLLGGCDDFSEQTFGSCDSCAESDVCSQVFDASFNLLLSHPSNPRFWVFDQYLNGGEPAPGYRVIASLASGSVSGALVDALHLALCVRDF
jgi:hypothetical protein